MSSGNFVDGTCASLPNGADSDGVVHPIESNSDRTFTLEPADNLSYGTTYQLRVETDVQDQLGNNMTSQYTHSDSITISPLLASADSDVFVAVGQNGTILRSTNNGASWDNETCQVFTNLNAVGYGNNCLLYTSDAADE